MYFSYFRKRMGRSGFSAVALLLSSLYFSPLAYSACPPAGVTVSTNVGGSSIACNPSIMGDCCVLNGGQYTLKTCSVSYPGGYSGSEVYAACIPTGVSNGTGTCKAICSGCGSGNGCYCPDGSDTGLPENLLTRCLIGGCAYNPSPPAGYPFPAGCNAATAVCQDLSCYCDACHNTFKGGHAYFCNGDPPPTIPPATPPAMTPNPVRLRPYDPG